MSKMPVLLILLLLIISAAEPKRSNNTAIESFSSSLSLFSYKALTDFENVPWCDLKCDNGAESVACTVQKNCLAIDAPCKFIYPDQAKLLDGHNEFRNKFAGGLDSRSSGITVSNMMILEWDDGLAYTAHCNLKKCPPKMDHDKCHRTEKFKVAGQNLAWTATTTEVSDCFKDTRQMITDWYEEIKDVKLSDMKAFATSLYIVEGAKIGHFTQLVWATHTHMGCALYTKVQDDLTHCMLACNYGPGGNDLGKSMYKNGDPASDCPDGLKPNKKYPALCGGAIEESGGMNGKSGKKEKGGGANSLKMNLIAKFFFVLAVVLL